LASEEIPEPLLRRIENKLLSLTTDESEVKLLRRRALEAMGFSSRPEMKELIRSAYNKDDPEWLISSIFAMGRSANSVWIPSVLDILAPRTRNVGEGGSRRRELEPLRPQTIIRRARYPSVDVRRPASGRCR